MELLLASGADATAADDNGTALVMLAAGAGNMAVLERALALGGDPCAQDLSGWGPLHWAAANGQAGEWAVVVCLKLIASLLLVCLLACASCLDRVTDCFILFTCLHVQLPSLAC